MGFLESVIVAGEAAVLEIHYQQVIHSKLFSKLGEFPII